MTRYENGDIANGGYSTAIRAHERFTFAIPDKLSSVDAAPMLCAGLTVYAPLENLKVGPGSKVGIVGVGGLGHFAVQFATAMGAEVTAFTHQPSDKDKDAREMGAKNVVNTSQEGFAKELAGKFDCLLSTVDDVAGLDMPNLLSMLKLHGTYAQVGLPDKPVQLNMMDLAGNNASLSVSHIGSKAQANRMLQLAADKGVKCWSQVIKMKDVGQAIESVKTNGARYRYVLEQDLVKYD